MCENYYNIEYWQVHNTEMELVEEKGEKLKRGEWKIMKKKNPMKKIFKNTILKNNRSLINFEKIKLKQRNRKEKKS